MAAALSPARGAAAAGSYRPQSCGPTRTTACRRPLHGQPAMPDPRAGLVSLGVPPPCSRSSRREATAAAQGGASGSRQMPDMEEMIEIGKVSSAHGVRGELKVIPNTDFPEERFMTPGIRYLKAPSRRRGAAQMMEVNLVKGRRMLNKGRELWLVTLEEVTSKEEADALSQHTIFAGDRPPLEEGEIYVQDMIDMQVILQETGEVLGRVTDVYEGTGQFGTIRIALEPTDGTPAEMAGTCLVPFTNEMVPEVDVEMGRMVINAPEGLIEATTSTPKAVKVSKRPRRRRRPAKASGSNGDSAEASDQSE